MKSEFTTPSPAPSYPMLYISHLTGSIYLKRKHLEKATVLYRGAKGQCDIGEQCTLPLDAVPMPVGASVTLTQE